MNLKRPIWFGVLVAPIAVPILYFLGIVIFSSELFHGFTDVLLGLIAVSTIALPITYIAAIALGLPLVLALRHFGKLSFWWVVLPAVPIGIIFSLPAYLNFFVVKETSISEVPLFVIGVSTLFSFAVALAFCLVVGIMPNGKKYLTQDDG